MGIAQNKISNRNDPNGIALLYLTQASDIVTPILAENGTVVKPLDSFRVLSWNRFDLDGSTTAQIRSYLVKSDENADCDSVKTSELKNSNRLLCMTKSNFETCRMNVGGWTPPGGTSRPLIDFFEKKSIDDGRSDILLGLEISTNEPCEYDQRELFIPISDHTDWIAKTVFQSSIEIESFDVCRLLEWMWIWGPSNRLAIRKECPIV